MAGLVLAALALAAAIAAGAAPRPPSVRYVTLNLHHGGFLSALAGDDEAVDLRLEIVADELRALRADVVGIQEASVTPMRRPVVERLAGRLGFHFAFAPALRVLTFQEGPAILSRFPILAWEVHDLPDCGRLTDSRVLLFAELGTPWGRLPVFSTHTSAGACHTRRVADLVRARSNGMPAVLMGDFNAVEGSPAIAALTTDAGFVDAFRAANPSAAGLTHPQALAAAGATVARRIDYLFLAPGTASSPARILSSRVVLNAPRSLPDGRLLWPSDHYGVLADIAVVTPRAPARSKAKVIPSGPQDR